MYRWVYPILVVLVFLLSCATASAQAVIAPVAATFNFSDASPLTGVQLDFFQCSGVSGSGTTTQGTGCAATPFQAGAVIPIANVTTQAPDQFGNTKSISLTQAPASGLLGSVPAGVPFVATVLAIGDPNQGLGPGPRSVVSNPFFSGLKAPGAPSGTRVK